MSDAARLRDEARAAAKLQIDALVNAGDVRVLGVFSPHLSQFLHSCQGIQDTAHTRDRTTLAGEFAAARNTMVTGDSNMKAAAFYMRTIPSTWGPSVGTEMHFYDS